MSLFPKKVECPFKAVIKIAVSLIINPCDIKVPVIEETILHQYTNLFTNFVHVFPMVSVGITITMLRMADRPD